MRRDDISECTWEDLGSASGRTEERSEETEKKGIRTMRVLEEFRRLDALLMAPVTHRLLDLRIERTPGVSAFRGGSGQEGDVKRTAGVESTRVPSLCVRDTDQHRQRPPRAPARRTEASERWTSRTHMSKRRPLTVISTGMAVIYSSLARV